ncbi:hypothetical protein SAMN04487781_3036 [Cellulosimicrobium cellulans]|nr:hypothetical protein SAMN04487781_3036 [Cellulosimicrobium cellulans]
MQRHAEREQDHGDRGPAEDVERGHDGHRRRPAAHRDDGARERPEDDRVAHGLGEHEPPRRPSARRHVEHEQRDGREHEELEQDHRHDGGRVPQHVDRDGQPDVVRVHVAGADGADRRLGSGQPQPEPVDEHEHARRHDGGRRGDREGRLEQRADVGPGEDGEQQRRARDEEPDAVERGPRVGAPDAEARGDVPGGHDDGDDGEAGEDGAHSSGQPDAGRPGAACHRPGPAVRGGHDESASRSTSRPTEPRLSARSWNAFASNCSPRDCAAARASSRVASHSRCPTL